VTAINAQSVPVLIAGGGSVGLTASILLARHGVRSLVTERHRGTSTRANDLEGMTAGTNAVAILFTALGRCRSCAVGVGSVRNIQDDYRAPVLIDPVTHAPVRSPAGGMLPGVFVMQRVTDTVRVVQQRAGDELRRGRSDLLRQPGELALRPGTHIELPPAGRAGHAAPASRNR